MKPHITISLVPAEHYALGLVKGPSFLKLALLKLEIGVCWIDHSIKAGGLGIHL